MEWGNRIQLGLTTICTHIDALNNINSIMELHWDQTRSRCRYISIYNMANRKLLLCLLIINLVLFVVECKFRSKSSSGSKSRLGSSRRKSGSSKFRVTISKPRPKLKNHNSHTSSSRFRSTTHKQPFATTRSYGNHCYL